MIVWDCDSLLKCVLFLYIDLVSIQKEIGETKIQTPESEMTKNLNYHVKNPTVTKFYQLPDDNFFFTKMKFHQRPGEKKMILAPLNLDRICQNLDLEMWQNIVHTGGIWQTKMKLTPLYLDETYQTLDLEIWQNIVRIVF